MYFSRFPLIPYAYIENGITKQKLIPNVLLSFRLNALLKTNGNFFFEYIYKDGDRPDILAHKLYGRSDLHWLILLMNDIVNPYSDFPKSYDELNDFIASSYPYQTFFVDTASIDSLGGNFFDAGMTITQGSAECAIVEWIPTYQKLRVDGVSGSFTAGSTAYVQNQDGVTFGFRLSRIIQDETESVHHFEDASTNETLDPLGYVIDNEQSRSIGVPLQSPERLIDVYTNNGIITQNTITIREYEEAKNEETRTIKLLRPEYVDMVLKEFDSLVKTVVSRENS